jgi:hypothetical protein
MYTFLERGQSWQLDEFEATKQADRITGSESSQRACRSIDHGRLAQTIPDIASACRKSLHCPHGVPQRI